jgi:hypothetical protein
VCHEFHVCALFCDNTRSYNGNAESGRKHSVDGKWHDQSLWKLTERVKSHRYVGMQVRAQMAVMYTTFISAGASAETSFLLRNIARDYAR